MSSELVGGCGKESLSPIKAVLRVMNSDAGKNIAFFDLTEKSESHMLSDLPRPPNLELVGVF
jgi:hypothetical protein